MFEERFSFSGSPFRLAPDPKFFFGSKSHNKAMSYLHYGLRQAEGFIVITGEIGAGKTMLIGHLLDQLDRSNVVAANLLTPNLEAADLLSHILSAFRVEAAGEGKAADIEAFEDFLFDQLNHGRRVLLVVDEAQNLPLKTLEELRVLSNMEYDGTPLFQVFLVGQPDFRDTMARSDMEQLRQRVIATYHLEPMTREETEGYIKHRLAQVGWTGAPALTRDAFDAIHAATGGVPRKIHKLCNRILLFAAVENRESIDGAAVAAVIDDLIAEQTAAPAGEDGEALVPVPPPSVANAGRAETGKPTDAPPPAQPAASRTGPLAPMAADSVFDRLKSSRKKGAAASKAAEPQLEDAAAAPPAAATLDDVASAIAAAHVIPRAEHPADETAALTGAEEADDCADDAGRPDFADDPAAWKAAVVASINDTREELKRAHQSVARIRRQLTEIDSRRQRRRDQIDAGLGRAETLLSEIRNAWR